MTTVTIPKKEYQGIIHRQSLIERELAFLKKKLVDFDEKNIKPSVLLRWERISRDLDQDRGQAFSSLKDMKKWLKNL